ncbi:unnamed protein product [Knipowitschia caucasica]|uniref:SHSP domain-containing protein n=1 Tax=Knipowitschia caucasica TaxID=637954 RepID=A0AAV2MQ83_KNICA
MNDQVKGRQSSSEHGTAGPWYPLRKWWIEPSRCFNQDSGLLPLLDLGGPRRTDWLERSLWPHDWLWYSPGPLFVPHISGSMRQAGPSSPSSDAERFMWRVCLDLSHFSPSEITLSVKDGLLQVQGRHEERPDQHGFVARCFTRKYRLPAEMDACSLVSWFSVDGILTVEAPVAEPSVPASVIIPIKVEAASAEDQKEMEDQEESKAAEAHVDSSANGGVQEGDERDEREEREEREERPEVSRDQEGTEPEEIPTSGGEHDACKGCEISQEII